MKVTVGKGENLHQALQKVNSAPMLPCGGKGTCGGCVVNVEKFGKVKACQFRLQGTYEVSLPKEREYQAVGLQDYEAGNASFVAVDLGTTTVVVLAFSNGRRSSTWFVNPQRAYGADVMTRIEQSKDADVAAKLQRMLKMRLDEAIHEVVTQLGMEASIEEVPVYLAGNTTMIHLLMGWDASGLGSYPFAPVSLAWTRTANYQIFPGISAFVGGDIVSGIYGLGITKEKRNCLLLDLGTNGEMALWAKGQLYVASAACGPAFEGTDLAGKLHASGIIHTLAIMLAEKSMDREGLLTEEYFEKGYELPEYQTSITQEDIRQIQMAKGAIGAGIFLLLRKANLSPEEIDQFYLAGGMGYFLDAGKASAIGLIPMEFVDKCKVCGNTSLLGAVTLGMIEDTFLRQKEEESIQLLAKEAEELLLANHPDFMDEYVKHMNFGEPAVAQVVVPEYTVIDLEMTGLNAKTDKIIEIGAVKVRDGKIVDTLGLLVDPGVSVPERITEITGITTDMVRGQTSVDEGMHRLLAFLGDDLLVGQNVNFDYGFMKQWAVNHKVPLEIKACDTLKLARILLPNGQQKNLEALCSYFGIERQNAHRALDDAVETMQVFERLKKLENAKAEYFEPKQLMYKAKKQSPATQSQKEQLIRYRRKYALTDEINIDGMTRSEVSRLMDFYYTTYGR